MERLKHVILYKHLGMGLLVLLNIYFFTIHLDIVKFDYDMFLGIGETTNGGLVKKCILTL